MAVKSDGRTPLVLVSGWRGPVEETARSFLGGQGTVVIRHDLADLGQGVVRRTVTTGTAAVPVVTTEILELAHGCVSCTLRFDLLPLLRKLHARSTVDRVVLELDPALEPEAVCWAIEHVPVVGVVGRIDGPAARDIRVEAVVTCVDVDGWWDAVTGDEDLDDDRTVAQVAVGQVAFADALVVHPSARDPWLTHKVRAVLARLAPGAPWCPQRTDPRSCRGSAPTPAEVGSTVPIRRRCADVHRSRRNTVSHSSSSPRADRSTRVDCTRRSTSCSTGSSPPAAGSGSRRGPTPRCGSNPPAGDCGWPLPTAGSPT